MNIARNGFPITGVTKVLIIGLPRRLNYSIWINPHQPKGAPPMPEKKPPSRDNQIKLNGFWLDRKLYEDLKAMLADYSYPTFSEYIREQIRVDVADWRKSKAPQK
jgi:hypothetical protein